MTLLISCNIESHSVQKLALFAVLRAAITSSQKNNYDTKHVTGSGGCVIMDIFNSVCLHLQAVSSNLDRTKVRRSPPWVSKSVDARPGHSIRLLLHASGSERMRCCSFCKRFPCASVGSVYSVRRRRLYHQMSNESYLVSCRALPFK